MNVYVIQYHDERLRESELEKFAFTTLEEATKELEKNNYKYDFRYDEYYMFPHNEYKHHSATIIELEVIQ